MAELFDPICVDGTSQNWRYQGQQQKGILEFVRKGLDEADPRTAVSCVLPELYRYCESIDLDKAVGCCQIAGYQQGERQLGWREETTCDQK
jgi:hypothetical protein